MRKPNLLFVFTDEQRCSTMGAYGNAQIDTPNLNSLANESVVFERAYVSQPVCTPSRATLLTGLYPHSNGCTENNIPLRKEVPSLAEMLDNEYATAYHGKWHLGDEIFAQHGFDEWRGTEDSYSRYYSEERDPNARSHYYHWLIGKGLTPKNGDIFTRGEAARLPEEFSKPAYLAEESARFIRANKNHPFCLFVNFLEPHMPFYGPRDDQYDPDDIPLPGNFENWPTEDQPLKTQLFARGYHERGFGNEPLKRVEDWQKLIARYWGMCSHVDTHFGTIMNTLEECGLMDDTIIVYTSDHGDMMGSHRLLAKCVMFEEAARVPLLVRMPGAKPSHRVAPPVSQVDLVPTLLDLMGQPLPGHLEGQSLRPSLESNAEPARDVVMEWNGVNSGFGTKAGSLAMPDGMLPMASEDDFRAAIGDPVRTIISADGWKFNCSSLGEHELYNLNNDPGEIDNLAKKPKMACRMAELRERLRAWQKRTGDVVDLGGSRNRGDA